jgi:3-oxoacyl-(acyl-carrier-protein) synthase
MKAYINGMGIVSPQKTLDEKGFLDEVQSYNSNCLRCIEPSYKDFLNPALARRMGRIIKMSIAASSVCLKDAGITSPDAIMTGTALGCHEDTEKFLLSIIDNEEQFLTPTSFIQSTHNTVSAQIALQLKCMNYNFTFVHKGFSFESAVLDGLMTLAEGEAKNVLVGGHDEMTDRHFVITSRIGYWKKESLPTEKILESNTEGAVSGEGSSFFVLGAEKQENSYALLRGLRMIYKPENQAEIDSKIEELLSENGLTAADVDVVLYGINGDSRFDKVYEPLRNGLLKNSTACWFKHLCGEYQTSSSFAMWAAARILKEGRVPESLLLDKAPTGRPRHVLIYNTFMDADHAVFLLSATDQEK